MLALAFNLITLACVCGWACRRHGVAYRVLIDAVKRRDPSFWQALGTPDGSGWDFTHAFGWRTPLHMYLKDRRYMQVASAELSAAAESYRRFVFRTGPTSMVIWVAASIAGTEVISRTLA